MEITFGGMFPAIMGLVVAIVAMLAIWSVKSDIADNPGGVALILRPARATWLGC